MKNVDEAADAVAEAKFDALAERVQETLGELAGAAKEGLLALSVGVGLGVLTELMAEEVDGVVGPKGRHDADRAAVRHGSEAGQVTLGGRRVPVDRPRVRATDGSGEVRMATYAHFADRDPLTAVVLEQMLAGVSTRRFSRTREPVGEEIGDGERSTSKSAVSREFVARTGEPPARAHEPLAGRRAPRGADARRHRAQGPLLRRRGLTESRPWTNREATLAKEVPRRLAVLGGGVVGVELAQAWRMLGAQVTLIEAADRPLAREEPFAGDQVQESLLEQGVEVRCDSKVVAVQRADDGELTIETEGAPEVRADELLVAVGRRPHTDDAGLETVGLEPGRYLEVDDAMRVTGVEGDWLYAVGDVNGRVLLTHMGKYQACAAAHQILGGDSVAEWDGHISPRVIFTDPQVAAVGHTLQTAQDAGLNVRAVDRDTSGNAGASFYGRETRGTCRLVIDEDRKVIVGATFTGFEVADFIHAATIAVVGEVPLRTVWHAIPSFPTRSEVWLNLFEEYGF